MDRTKILGLRRSLPAVIQGATAVFGDNSVDDRCGLLDDVLAAGIDAFDTGMVYADALGTCDGRLGSWIAERGIRHDVTVIGKGCHPAPPDWSVSRVRPEYVAEDLDRTLDRMGTDYLDLWLFHRDDTTVPVDELADAAAKLVEAGLADAWGVSNWTVDRLREAREVSAANDWVPPVVTSPHFSLVHQVAEPWPGVVSIAGPAAVEDREWLADEGIPVLAWSSLAGGYLTGGIDARLLADPDTAVVAEVARCYHSPENWSRRQRAVDLAAGRDCTLEQMAVAWVLTAPFPTHALCASRTGVEARANMDAVDVALSPAERSWLEGGGGQ